MHADEAVATLRRWLAKNKGVSEDIGMEVDLIESRLLTSLDLVEFTLQIETLSGRRLITEDLDPTKVRTLSAIRSAFFSRPPC